MERRGEESVRLEMQDGEAASTAAGWCLPLARLTSARCACGEAERLGARRGREARGRALAACLPAGPAGPGEPAGAC